MQFVAVFAVVNIPAVPRLGTGECRVDRSAFSADVAGDGHGHVDRIDQRGGVVPEAQYGLTAFVPPADEPMHGNRVFVPFRDQTSAKETYGAGRYLDLNRREGNEYVVDFNRAYNPFCAYSPYYSCPLPPGENILQVEIRAGEKQFHA